MGRIPASNWRLVSPPHSRVGHSPCQCGYFRNAAAAGGGGVTFDGAAETDAAGDELAEVPVEATVAEDAVEGRLHPA